MANDKTEMTIEEMVSFTAQVARQLELPELFATLSTMLYVWAEENEMPMKEATKLFSEFMEFSTAVDEQLNSGEIIDNVVNVDFNKDKE